ncbi:MAG: sigma factor [Acidimicrobiia bacterium]
MDEPDPGLIRAAAKGDHDAFAQLVRAHQTMVWHFLCRLLDDRSLAEDVTQETFIRVYMKLPTFSYRSGRRALRPRQRTKPAPLERLCR